MLLYQIKIEIRLQLKLNRIFDLVINLYLSDDSEIIEKQMLNTSNQFEGFFKS